MTRPLERPEALQGSTYKIRWPEHDHAIYITINDIIRDGRRQPFEIFINSKNTEHYAWTVALTRMISAVFPPGAATCRSSWTNSRRSSIRGAANGLAAITCPPFSPPSAV